MLEDDTECESFQSVISIETLLVYDNKFYKIAYKVVNKRITDYLNDNLFED